MKQFLRKIFSILLKLFILILLIKFSSFNLVSQENNEDDWDYTSAMWWDDRPYTDIFVSDGTNYGKTWQATTWLTCSKNGTDPLVCTNMPEGEYAPFAPPGGGSNNTYILIHKNDSILLEESFDYKNRLTLVICGYLYIGEDFLIDEPIKFTSFISKVNDNFSIEPSAIYESDFSLIQASFNYGFSIVPLDLAYDIFDPTHRIYPLYTDYFDNTDWNETYNETSQKWVGDFDFTNLTHWKKLNGEMEPEMESFREGVEYEIVPFVEDEFGAAFYYDTANLSFTFSSSKTGEDEITIFDSSEEISAYDKSDDDANTFNSFRLYICDGGTLHLSSINVKNNALFHIDGTFIVTGGIDAGNNYCFTGSGYVTTDPSGLPPVNDEEFPGTGLAKDCDFNLPLPIELYTFDSKVHPEHIELNWVTASEINNEFFTLERSSDLYAWEIVGHLQGAGTTSEKRHYSYNDYSPREGISYYRLKQTDFDGQFEYFGPLSVMYMPGADGLDFRIARHPDQWTLHVPGEGAYHVELYDLTGRKIFSDMVVNNITIPAPNQTVVVRVFNDRHHSASRVVMQ